MKKLIAIILVLIPLFLAGCGRYNTLSVPQNEFVREQVSYIENLGLKVVSYEEQPLSSYILTKDDLLGRAMGPKWMDLEVYDKVDASVYLGKTIDIYKFVVKGHRYEKTHAAKQSNAWLLTSNNKIIGGYALPITKEKLIGGTYHLHGDSEKFEEIAGKSYLEFHKYWTEKYSNDKSGSELPKGN